MLGQDQISLIFQTRKSTLASVVLCFLTLCVQLSSSQTIIRFSPSDIESVVNTHNNLRGSVDPPASNMQALVSLYSYMQLQQLTARV